MEDYKDKIKDSCSWCGAKIKGTLDYYMSHGNSCADCSAMFTRISKGPTKKVTTIHSEWGYSEEKEVKDGVYTPEEKKLLWRAYLSNKKNYERDKSERDSYKDSGTIQ